MTTLREKIEGLTKYHNAGRWEPGGPLVALKDVLRIVDEHEREKNDLMAAIWGLICQCTNSDRMAMQNAVPNVQLLREIRELRAQLVPVPDITPGGPRTAAAGQGGGEEFRPGLPSEAMRKAWGCWTVLDSRGGSRADLEFKGDVYRFAWWIDDMPDRRIESCSTWHLRHFRPRGKTWAELDRMAGAGTEGQR